MTVREEVAEFFARFAATSDNAGGDGAGPQAGASFHPTLLTLDPVSVTPVTREHVVASLPRRKEFFAGLGITGMTLDSLEESPIDDLHTLARTTWQLERTESSSIPEGTTFASTYLLRKVDGDWQIVVYLNHQDLRSLASA